jgi:ABC-type multidrug transport system ATPase subunit
VVDGFVSLNRITEFLKAESLTFQAKVDADSPFGVQIGGSYLWEVEEGQEEVIALSDLDIKIPKGSLVGIVGGVGSGKSSLLSALIGELSPKMDGSSPATVIFSGSVAYCPQQYTIPR